MNRAATSARPEERAQKVDRKIATIPADEICNILAGQNIFRLLVLCFIDGRNPGKSELRKCSPERQMRQRRKFRNQEPFHVNDTPEHPNKAESPSNSIDLPRIQDLAIIRIIDIETQIRIVASNEIGKGFVLGFRNKCCIDVRDVPEKSSETLFRQKWYSEKIRETGFLKFVTRPCPPLTTSKVQYP
jgi:hypothetical protein